MPTLQTSREEFLSSAIEISPLVNSLPELSLLVRLEPRGRAFLQNLRYLLGKKAQPVPFPQAAPLRQDVFIPSPMPWPSFSESIAYHILAMSAILAWMHWTPRAITRLDPWKDTRVITYPLSASQKADLPKLDTGSPAPHRAQQGDPALNRQPILSVPREPDNRAQTIVTPPDLVLRNEIKLPNIVAWTSLPVAPAVSATGLESRRSLKAPEVSVVAPPPQLEPERRNRLEMPQTTAVAPPPELKDARTLRNAAALTATAVEPAPQVNSLTTRKIGTLDIGHAVVIAPAPKLAVGEQQAQEQAAARGRAAAAQAMAATAVPPPPSIAGNAAPGAGRMIALGLHPAPAEAAAPPPGNRRGEFEAGPAGSAKGSGSPTNPETGKTTDRSAGTGGPSEHPDLPAGIKVGEAKGGDQSAGAPGVPLTAMASISIDRYPIAASTAPPRVDPNRKPATVIDHPLTDAEKKVFGGRRFYSMTLNMPNLNSAGGSWIVRFAELKEGPRKGELFSPVMTRKADPAYPAELQRANVQGTVTLYAIIHSDGSVRDIRVLDSVDDQLDRFASEALARCRFEPGLKDGEPVALEAVVMVPFRARKRF